MPNSPVQSRRLGVIGCSVGLLALIAAVLPHWVVPAIFPPPPFEQVMDDTSHKLRDRLLGHKKGVEIQTRVRDEGWFGDRVSSAFSAAAVSLSLFAIALAVVSLIFREEKLYAGVSAALGIVALAIEVSYILMPFVLLILLVILYLGS
jgi:hypothetical protein